MDDTQVLDRMRDDWNRRAAEDANYYVAFGRRDQDEDEFFATAAAVVKGMEWELPRLPGRDAALEIGCGPGRLMRPLSRHFKEIHGVDVSDSMIALARQRLRHTPNAFPHHSSGSDLSLFPGGQFDFVFSYAVFQHIPSREVVFQYLREARRVLKPLGIVRCQINGLPPTAKQYDTWSGVRITPGEIAEFTLRNDFQLLALEMIDTQYMWITLRKRPAGWVESLAGRRIQSAAAIRNVSNALTSEAVAPSSGPMAALSLWIERLPEECDPQSHGRYRGRNSRPPRVHRCAGQRERATSQRLAPRGRSHRHGACGRHVAGTDRLPHRLGAHHPARPVGRAPHHRHRRRQPVAGPSDRSGSVKVTLIEVADPDLFHATVDGRDVLETDSFCSNPLGRCYEFNFRMPAGTARARTSCASRWASARFSQLPLRWREAPGSTGAPGGGFRPAASLAWAAHRRASRRHRRTPP
jgi:SAM-dependent methyltransferase